MQKAAEFFKQIFQNSEPELFIGFLSAVLKKTASDFSNFKFESYNPLHAMPRDWPKALCAQINMSGSGKSFVLARYLPQKMDDFTTLMTYESMSFLEKERCNIVNIALIDFLLYPDTQLQHTFQFMDTQSGDLLSNQVRIDVLELSKASAQNLYM